MQVYVEIPNDKTTLRRIHRTIEHVLQYGAPFEAALTRRKDALYEFVHPIGTPSSETLNAHNYYRWKLYSILRNETLEEWNMKPVQLMPNGKLWIPPICPFPKIECYKKEDCCEYETSDYEVERARLSPKSKHTLLHLLKHLTSEKNSIGYAMCFCILHSQFALDVFLD